eukprot:INCI19063.1.p1 GENE.INCI19063.1~~INCI19063.1.p1  ORF type:complete len:649 (+),score=79.27 INCI19063.1:222-2168(+)
MSARLGAHGSGQASAQRPRSRGHGRAPTPASSNSNDAVPDKPLVIAGKYKLGEQLGSGSFGAIFFASHIHSGQHVAVKLETSKAHKQRRSQLEIEYRLYRILQGHVGIPRIYWFGRESGCRALVMELLGPSLEDMFKRCKRLFSVKTVCLLALQMLNLVQYLHSQNLLHRDIKPANFVMGVGANAPRVYVIDFGLSKKYINSAHAHVRYRIGKNLTGTPRYASINNHDGVEQSRRDDLESLGYVFMYFVRGSLPWQGLRAKNKLSKFQKIHHKKVQVSLDELCAGFPPEFKAYLHYCRRLAFEESPDYTYLKGLFKKVMITEGFKLDSKFDWMMSDEERLESKESKQNRVHGGGGGGAFGAPRITAASGGGAQAQAQMHLQPPTARTSYSRPSSARQQYPSGSMTARNAPKRAVSATVRTTPRPAMRRNDSIRGIRTKALNASGALYHSGMPYQPSQTHHQRQRDQAQALNAYSSSQQNDSAHQSTNRRSDSPHRPSSRPSSSTGNRHTSNGATQPVPTQQFHRTSTATLSAQATASGNTTVPGSSGSMPAQTAQQHKKDHLPPQSQHQHSSAATPSSTSTPMLGASVSSTAATRGSPAASLSASVATSGSAGGGGADTTSMPATVHGGNSASGSQKKTFKLGERVVI